MPPNDKQPMETVNLGNNAASVEISDIVAMRERQTELIDSVDYSELD